MYLIILLSLVALYREVYSAPKVKSEVHLDDYDSSRGVTYLPPMKTSNPKEYVQSTTINTGYFSPPNVALLPPTENVELHTILDANPALAALLLSSTLGIQQKAPGFNHPQHLPINPYVALLLSHYGRYVPVYGMAHGIYGYTAANNYHNNKPFGSYKIYEDRDN